MARPATKAEIITASNENYNKLISFIDDMSQKELGTVFDFSADPKKKEAHWGRDKNLRDVLIHLYQWQMLLIKCIDNFKQGIEKPFLPEEYSWRTYGDMNMMFWKSNQTISLEDAKKNLECSHNKVMELVDEYTDEELFTKGLYKWTGGSNAGSYFISTTSSHYDWALKKLKAHRKNCKES